MNTEQLLAIQTRQEMDNLILGFTYKRRGKDVIMEKTRIFLPEQTSSGVIWEVCVGLKDPDGTRSQVREYNYLFKAISKRMDVFEEDGSQVSLDMLHAVSARYSQLAPVSATLPIPPPKERKNKKIAKGNESDHEANLEEIPIDAPRVNIPTADEMIQSETVARNVEFGESLESNRYRRGA